MAEWTQHIDVNALLIAVAVIWAARIIMRSIESLQRSLKDGVEDPDRFQHED